MSRVILVLLFLVCAVQPKCCLAQPARASGAFGELGDPRAIQVTPALLSAVQGAIRWREGAWSDEECRARARDFTDAGERWGLQPPVLLAIAINESDLRTKAIRHDRGALDLGLMAVRCRVGADGRCSNKPVRGMTPAQVMRPGANIEMGARILAKLHGGDLASYNTGRAGGTRYPQKVGAILAALGGVEVRVKGQRLRTLVRRIVAAVQRERRS